MLIKTFKYLSRDDIAIAGGKGASLGEMTQAKIPVPPGFVISASAFDNFLAETDLGVEIEAALRQVNHKELSSVDEASSKIRDLILDAKFPDNLAKEVLKEFPGLKTKYVAVRSSATAEDSSVASWAGELETYLNTTKNTLIENIKKCWASLFTPRAIFYRYEKKMQKTKVSVAVVVQKMVQSEVSGICFTVHPVTEDRNQMVIEAGWGLGEAIVGGKITPDTYIISKRDFDIIDKNISEQNMMIVGTAKGVVEKGVPKSKAGVQKLLDRKIIELARLCQKIEEHYGKPQDIEWAMEKGQFFIVQSRPITTLQDKLIVSEKLVLSHKEVNVSGFTISVNFWGWINDWLSQTCGVENFGTMACLFKGYETDFYIERNKFQKAHNEIAEKINKKVLPIDYAVKKSVNLGKNILSIVLANYSKLEKMSPNQVCELLSNVFDYSRAICSYGYIASLSDFPDEFITPQMEKILKKHDAKDITSLKIFLSTPKRKRPINIANEKLLKMIATKRDIQNWLDSWFWLDFGHIGSVLSKKTIKEKYKIYFDNPQKAKSELQKLVSENSFLEETQGKKFKKLGFSESEKQIFSYAQKIIFLKGYRTDILSAANAFFDKIFEMYSKRFRVSKAIFRFSTKDEVINFIRSKKHDHKNINKRKTYSIWVLKNEEEGIKIYIGKDAKKYESDILLSEKIEHEGKIIKGSTAFPGIVEGIVKIVNRPSDMKKIKFGEILVSTQTTPELLPAMNKAIAFITDIGGITSHAAIVAREMKKPCVVGTKIASRILKDGDLVEVDANKGIVKIIKRK